MKTTSANHKVDYLIVGSGRAAKHFAHYFNLLKINYETWNRTQSQEALHSSLQNANKVLVLISDSAIKNFIETQLFDFDGTVIHFSGALEIRGAISAHPLMTFGNDLYELEQYEKIPFVLVHPHKLSEIMPELKNPNYQISPQDKALYHALCVYSGNFTTLLWQEALRKFSDIGVPQAALNPYLMQIVSNIVKDAGNALTGPIARKDYVTIEKNRQSLQDKKMKKIFNAFMESYL